MLFPCQVLYAVQPIEPIGGAVRIPSIDPAAALHASVPVFLRSQAARHLISDFGLGLLRKRRKQKAARTRLVLDPPRKFHRRKRHGARIVSFYFLMFRIG